MIRRAAFIVFSANIIIAFAVLIGLPAAARASTVQYSSHVSWGPPNSFVYGMYTVIYGATATDGSGQNVCGASVPKGTQVRFAFKPHVSEDISWFLAGASWDSPYGSWDPNTPQLASLNQGETGLEDICSETDPQKQFENETSCEGDVSSRYSTTVKPPVKSVSGMQGAFECGAPDDTGSVTCTAGTAGSITASFVFADTYGTFFGPHVIRVAGSRQVIYGPVGSYSVPRQSIQCPVTVTASSENRPPNAPAVSGGACTVGRAYTITMTAVDPDGDNVKYGIDWDADGNVDQYVPASGYAPSGVARTASRTYSVAGAKNIQVKVFDERGAQSGWSAFQFTCDQGQQQCTLYFSPPGVNAGESSTLYWQASAPGTMRHSGASWAVPALGSGTSNSPEPYTLFVSAQEECTTQLRVCPAGTTWNGTECAAKYTCQLNGQCVATASGTYGTRAGCEAVCRASCDWQRECRGNDLWEYDANGSASCQSRKVQTCPFQCSTGRCIAPPDAKLSLSAHPTIVRRGDTTAIRWTAENVKRNTCTVSGAGDLWTQQNGANSWNGEETSGPIPARTVYTLGCVDLSDRGVSTTTIVNIIPRWGEK